MSSTPLKKRIIFDRDISSSALPIAGEDVMTSHDRRSKSTTNVNVVSIAKTIGEAVDSLETHFQCSICFDVICKSQRIPECGHRFCRDCIKDCINKCKRECPVCRCPVISTRNLREEKSFDELILSFREAQKIIKEQIEQLQGLQIKMVQVPSEINVNHDLLSPKKKPKVAREPDLFDDESNYSTEILPLCLRNSPTQKPNVKKVQSDASQSSKSDDEDDDEDESDEEVLPVSKRHQAKQNSPCKTSQRTRKDDSSKKKSEDEESEFSDFSSNSSSEDEEEDFRPISCVAKRLSSQSKSSKGGTNDQLSTGNLNGAKDIIESEEEIESDSDADSSYDEKETEDAKRIRLARECLNKMEQAESDADSSSDEEEKRSEQGKKKIGMRRKRLVIELLDSSDEDSIDSPKETKNTAENNQVVKKRASSSTPIRHAQRTKDVKNSKSDSTQNSDVIFDSSSDEDSDVNPSDFKSLDESDNKDLAPLKAKSSYNTYRPIRRRSKQPELYGSPVSADDDVIENILNSPGNVLTWTNDGSGSENENRFPKRRRRTRKGAQNRRERRHRKPERFGEIADSKEVDEFISSPENVLKWKNVAKDSDNELSNGSDEECNRSEHFSTTPKRRRSNSSEGRPESYLQRWSDRKSKPADKFTYNF